MRKSYHTTTTAPNLIILMVAISGKQNWWLMDNNCCKWGFAYKNDNKSVIFLLKFQIIALHSAFVRGYVMMNKPLKGLFNVKPFLTSKTKLDRILKRINGITLVTAKG